MNNVFATTFGFINKWRFIEAFYLHLSHILVFHRELIFGVLKYCFLKAIFANFYLNQFSMNNDLFPLSRLCLSTSCKAFKALPELHGWTTVPLLVKHQSWLIGYSLNCTFQSMATAFVNKCKRFWSYLK